VDELLPEFLIESHEHLARFEVDLVALERTPDDAELLASAYRALHTIKGSCGFLGLPRLEKIAHGAESLLSRLRDGEIRLTPAHATLLLRAVDTIRVQLDALENEGAEATGDDSELIAALVGEEPSGAPVEPVETSPAVVAKQSVRIDVELLDTLLNLVGELVTMRNRVLRSDVRGGQTEGRQAARRELDSITDQLQEAIMRARMEPIGRLFERMPRPVRDLATELGSDVEFECIGGETELDRTIIESIADPLTHLLRNAVHHGVESPEERERLGKPAAASLRLIAYQSGSEVVMEVRDDGRGIDRDALRDRASKAGLDTDADPLSFVFVPGISTATEVSSVSGRGVGMDVVRNNVERLGGTVEIESEPGAGTTVRIRLPLTLAIVPGVVVEAGGQRFVLAQRHLREMLRLRSREALDYLHDAPVYRLHGRLLPVVMLDEQLGLPVRDDAGASLAVVESEGRRFGLLVDRILDTQEIVVKPLGEPLRSLGIYAGATTLGDGKVALIVEPGALAEAAGVRTEHTADQTEPAVAAPDNNQCFLLVDAHDGRRLLLPLERIERLAEINPRAVERVAGRRVVAYRGAALPLVEEGADGAVLAERSTVPMVILRGHVERFGLLLGRVRDVVDAPAPEGALGTAIIAGEVAERVDIDALEEGLLVTGETAR